MYAIIYNSQINGAGVGTSRQPKRYFLVFKARLTPTIKSMDSVAFSTHGLPIMNIFT